MKLIPTRSNKDHRSLSPVKRNKSNSSLYQESPSSSSEQRRKSSGSINQPARSRIPNQNQNLNLNQTQQIIVVDNLSQGIQLTTSDSSSSLFEEELSTGTQESEYAKDCSSRYTDSSDRNCRFACFVYKRKAGFSWKMKQSYAVASERSKHLGLRVHQNMNLGLHMNKDFWKLGTRSGKHDKNGHADAGGDVVVNGNNSAAITAIHAPHDKMWERRRLVLEGNYLMYYHEDAEFDEEDRAFAGGANASSAKRQVVGLQRLKDKFHEFADFAHLRTPSQGAINNPKGVIDLVSEYATATVVPITPHSFAPTPYCLAIMVKSEVKWMLCFDDEKEITKWLRNLTKVALTQSVDRYAKNSGNDVRTLKMDSGEKRRRTMTPVYEDVRSQDTPNADNRGPVVMSKHDVSNSRTQKVAKSISDGSITSAKALMDGDAYKTIVLVNSVFLYLFVVVEEVLSLSHMFVFAIINMFTWLHLTKSASKRLSLVREDGRRLMNDSTGRSYASSIEIRYNDSLMSNLSISTDDQTLSSPSFIEKRKDLDKDDDIYRPKAGSTTVKVQKLNEKRNEDHKEKVGWMAGEPSIIHLRGQDYLTTCKKFPSKKSLYELVEVDTFDSDEHLTDVGQRFQFPNFDYGEDGNWCAPDTLIISFALPTTAPKLGRSMSDGKGYIVIGYYRIRTDVRKTLDIITNFNYDEIERERRLHELYPSREEKVLVNGIKLWEKWCRTSESDPEMQKRLKFIPRGENLKELGVPSWICRYNGKPMLIKRPGETSFVFSHPDERTLEIDINMHPLPYMFKQAMSYLKDHYFYRMPMTFAFVIEGREYDELPEVLLGDPLHLDKPGSVLDKRGSVMKSDIVFANPGLFSF